LVKIIRREGQLEIRIGERKQQKTYKIDLGDRSEAERWAEVFDALQDLSKKIMVAPPADSWLAEADAATLLKKRVETIPNRISSNTIVATIKIQTNWITLTLGGTEPPHDSDLYEWQDKITKMVKVKVAPPPKDEP